jgi:S1-C subfamily serine protease
MDNWSTPSGWTVPSEPVWAQPATAAPETPDLPTPITPAAGRRLVAAAVAGALAAALAVGVGSRLTLHGLRPTVASSSADSPASSAGPSSFGFASPGSGAAAVPASAGSLTAAEVAAVATSVEPGVVDVNTVLGNGIGRGAGTGVVLTPNGEVVTNNHVVDGATSITVTVADTGQTFPAAVVGTDPTEDVAVLQLRGASGLHTAPIGDSASVAVGDEVVALGNAGGVGGKPDVVTGTVVALDQTITATDESGANPETLSGLIQTDAPLQPGDSGGPLVDRSGRVVGLDTAASAGRRFRFGGTAGFAIPIAQVRSIAGQIVSGHASSTVHLGVSGFLGVVLAPDSGSGAVVDGVQPGSAAEAAGLAPGDTITSVDHQATPTPDALSSLIKQHHAGAKVSLGWTDTANGRHTATVTLGSGPAD